MKKSAVSLPIFTLPGAAMKWTSGDRRLPRLSKSCFASCPAA